ncbi:polysaccharide deacetylase family protein [Sabulicella rubraurantiaca]|uniref:polysaccharide deacetylase family protein n=1 Tax=Sabulicella rubraurantiaca TaxID=2811429 RepID=UPI001A95900C|nr:polysaccharide deacetylase family protein [Sabulicella rubraurantiaca]
MTPRERLRDWSPAPLPRASLWWHCAALGGVAAMPALWAEALGTVALNHLILGCAMHPRAALLGPNLRRLPEPAAGVALTFDDGPDPEVTPRVLDLLDRYGARATFFCIGRRAARNGPLLREALRRGHAVENHSHRHSPAFAARGPLWLWREVTEAQAAIADATGVAPRFFRAPMGLRSPLLDPVLAAAGLSLVSWTRRGHDALWRDPRRALRRLAGGLTPGDILLMHDGNAARQRCGTPVVLEVLPGLLDAMARAGLSAAALPAAAAAPEAAAPSPAQAAHA